MESERLILETSFLIDLEREFSSAVDRAPETEGPARRFLERHSEALLFVTPTIAGELAAVVSSDGRSRWAGMMSGFRRLPITEDAEWHYGQVYRYLRRSGRLIGSNDLWIAAVALAHEVPVVTANSRHFERVPNLAVRSYREAATG